MRQGVNATEQEEEPTEQNPEPAAGAPHGLGELAADIRGLIEAARLRVAQTVNAELVLLYWRIGNRIRRDVLGQARAEYGEEIVSTLSRQLTAEYGLRHQAPILVSPASGTFPVRVP
jgi:hypothetical protein